MFVKDLRCSKCGRIYSLEEKPVMCINKDLGRLDIRYDYEAIKNAVKPEDLAKREFHMWRYREFLPVPNGKYIVSLGEGGTPLIKAGRLAEKLGLKKLYLKDETRNPTGSFKDRCMSVSVSMAKYFGFKRAVVASSGNAAAALAAYGARAGIEVYAFVPDFAGYGKIAQLLFYGAKVFRVKWVEAEDPTVKMMRLLAEKYGFYPSPSFGPFNPYQIEGPKTIAMEIVEQLGWNVPDQVFVPTGAASLLTGVYNGFRDWNNVGWINKYPRMVAVQPEGNHPFVRAWMEKVDPDKIRPWEKPPKTIATGLEDTFPWDGDAGLRALYNTNGYGVVVSDEEILEAMKLLASLEGLFAEPSGAAGLAGLIKALEDGEVDRDETVVVLVTGHGLKDPDIVKKSAGDAPTINPDPQEFFVKAKEFYKVDFN
ncbi:threonine synthase [Staphylothermus hellenicus]|uniref:Threonine synthase n=1 Tax=Staphylothermus hellenicus (strain DSM 12710 / JCM 10830 / BK20S6-10-b1 / P8) TaxID=591019 RepID=D7DCF6_STAHD|nr:threonine synthase [Staphylothermus hellenicus]ADI31853.1 threonine synthase [Staphylothermus hellenicus DSM 12710]